jgi:hypothetical protein
VANSLGPHQQRGWVVATHDPQSPIHPRPLAACVVGLTHNLTHRGGCEWVTPHPATPSLAEEAVGRLNLPPPFSIWRLPVGIGGWVDPSAPSMGWWGRPPTSLSPFFLYFFFLSFFVFWAMCQANVTLLYT